MCLLPHLGFFRSQEGQHPSLFFVLSFRRGFEAGNLSAWSKVVDADSDLVVGSGVALVVAQGLEVNINDNTPSYLVDESHDSEARYRARFYFDPNSIDMSVGDSHRILRGFQENNTPNSSCSSGAIAAPIG